MTEETGERPSPSLCNVRIMFAFVHLFELDELERSVLRLEAERNAPQE
jgi:hypothetical protein